MDFPVRRTLRRKSNSKIGLSPFRDASLLGKWSWEEFEAPPQSTKKVDIHCVTKWPKLDSTWQGVTFDDLSEAVGLAKPPAPYIMAHCDGGYTTNLAVVVVDDKGNLRVPADYRTSYRMLGSRAVAKDDGPGSKEMHVVYASPGTIAAYRKTNTFPTAPFSRRKCSNDH
jgi:Oxidoreductase molybdopterin binding domain